MQFGPFKERATTDYWLKLARAGFVNGFYYPLIYQENMDDPRSQHNSLKSMSFEDAYRHTHGWQTGTLSDLESCLRLQSRILNNLLDDPWDPKFYRSVLWKRLLKRVLTIATSQRLRIPGAIQSRRVGPLG